jgi:hypothetical protein
MVNKANPFNSVKRNECDYISLKGRNSLINYMTISSNSIILGQNYESRKSRRSLQLIPIELIKKEYIVIYFEFHYFFLSGVDYIKSVYQENNIFVLFVINDDIEYKETIYLKKNEKEKGKYNPIVYDNKVNVIKLRLTISLLNI